MNFLDRKLYRFRWWREWRGLPPPMPPTVQKILADCLDIVQKVSEINREYESGVVILGSRMRIYGPPDKSDKPAIMPAIWSKDTE